MVLQLIWSDGIFQKHCQRACNRKAVDVRTCSCGYSKEGEGGGLSQREAELMSQTLSVIEPKPSCTLLHTAGYLPSHLLLTGDCGGAMGPGCSLPPPPISGFTFLLQRQTPVRSTWALTALGEDVLGCQSPSSGSESQAWFCLERPRPSFP